MNATKKIADGIIAMFSPMAKSLINLGLSEESLATTLAYVYNKAYQECDAGKKHLVQPSNGAP